MLFVAVKKKYQVVIPASVRRELGIEVGDLLEAKVDRGKITFTPKVVIDRSAMENPEETSEAMSSPLRVERKKRPASIQRVKKLELRKSERA